MTLNSPKAALQAPIPGDADFIARIKIGLKVEETRREAPAEFPSLPPIPGGRYTDPEFLQLEYEFLWKKSWHYVCHADQISAPGDFLLWNEKQSPIVIVRGQDGSIHAFYNTCRHRGAPLVRSAAGHVKGGFTCGYHGWSYALDGSLVGVRDRRDFPDLDFSCLGLLRVQCESFGKWIFVNEDPLGPGLMESLQPLGAQLARFTPDSIRHINSRTFDVACNVKVLLDGLLEVYHLKTTHPKTVDRFLDHRGTSQTLFTQGHSLMVTPNRNPEWVDPGTIGMPEFPGADELFRNNNVSFNLFPALVTPVTTTGMPFLALYPTGNATMSLTCHWFSPDWGSDEPHPLWEKRMENFLRILEEDLCLVPLIQQSMESPGFTGIQLGYQERRIYHWHEELERRIGTDRIPAHLRLEPRLSGMIEHPQRNFP